MVGVVNGDEVASANSRVDTSNVQPIAFQCSFSQS